MSLSKGTALFMEMGTGKTKAVIDTAAILHRAGVIKKVLVIAPLSLLDTWAGEEGELTIHGFDDEHLWWPIVGTKAKKLRALNTINCGAQCDQLIWGIINIEGIQTVKKELLDWAPDLVVIDESTAIKNRGAGRTDLVQKMFGTAPYKIIMSGNPIPKGPEEIFSQYRFIEPAVFGSRFFTFREKYFSVDYFKSITGFMTTELAEDYNEQFHSKSYVARKSECLDLPPKVYERRVVTMSPQQAKLYKEMRLDALTMLEDGSCSAPVVITQLMRLSQIAGGVLPVIVEGQEDPQLIDITPNPKLEALADDLERLDKEEQVVIWARFNREIQLIEERLKKMGIKCGNFYGKTKYKDRIATRNAFRAENIRVFIGNPATGGKGLNDLVGANTCMYYSNDYSAENRQQSEDRTHRSGTTGDKVTYIDYVSGGTIDELVLGVLQDNQDFSDAVLTGRVLI